MIGQILGTLVSPLTSLAAKFVERKAAKDSLRSKAVLSKLDSETQITLTDAEWEIAKAKSESGSWKDEWITIVITAPIACIILGSIMMAFGAGPELVNGAVAGITALNQAGVPMPELMTATVFAGLGLKLWRA